MSQSVLKKDVLGVAWRESYRLGQQFKSCKENVKNNVPPLHQKQQPKKQKRNKKTENLKYTMAI